MADDVQTTRELRVAISRELASLDTKEENLLDLAADGAPPQAKIRSRLTELGLQRSRLLAELQNVDSQLGRGAELIESALTLLEDPQGHLSAVVRCWPTSAEPDVL